MIFSPNGVLFRGKGKKLLKLLGKANSFLFAQKNAQFYYDVDLDYYRYQELFKKPL